MLHFINFDKAINKWMKLLQLYLSVRWSVRPSVRLRPPWSSSLTLILTFSKLPLSLPSPCKMCDVRSAVNMACKMSDLVDGHFYLIGHKDDPPPFLPLLMSFRVNTLRHVTADVNTSAALMAPQVHFAHIWLCALLSWHATWSFVVSQFNF